VITWSNRDKDIVHALLDNCHLLFFVAMYVMDNLLKVLLDKFSEDKEAYSHLDPEQLDGKGDCLFHLVAKMKYSSHVLKVT